MSLQRSNTRFGLSSLRGATPESDDNLNDTRSLLAGPEYGSSNKLRKRGLASRDSSRDASRESSRESSRDYEAPLKMRRLSQDKGGEEARIGFQGPKILQASQLKPRAVVNVKIKHSSPWDSLQKHFSMMLNDSVTIASRKYIASQEDALIVAVRQFSGPNADRKVAMLQRIRNENFLACLEYFSFEESLYVVMENELSKEEKLPITLRQYTLIGPYPTEEEVILILEPILNGLEYLASVGLEHGALTCKNVLIGLKGSIKIAGQECCRELVSSRGSLRDIKGVGCVVMELINKDSNIDGPIKVHDPHRWPLNSNVVKFLLRTESAYSINELKNHPLIKGERRQIGLDIDQELYREVVFKANVYTAELQAFRGYKVV